MAIGDVVVVVVVVVVGVKVVVVVVVEIELIDDHVRFGMYQRLDVGQPS